MSNGGAYVSVVLSKGFDDGDVFAHGVLPFVVRGVEKIFYEFGILKPMNASQGRMAMSSVPSTLSDQ